MSQQLIICGMHRSGTSLVASVLQEAGLDLGSDLSGPGLGNRRGHFEDLDFFRLHDDMLAVAGESCFSAENDFVPPERADFERRAQQLVAERGALPLWGWKDPRTCLFLEFWNSFLPDARYVFLYRHPVDVALSLWRRDADLELRQDPWLAVSSWEVYNRRLLGFFRRHSDRIFLAQVPTVAADLGELVRRLNAKLGLALKDGNSPTGFAPEELAPRMISSLAWEELIPAALAVYRQLEKGADLRETHTRVEAQSPRQRDLLRASELLLYTVLETHGRKDSTAPLELRQAYYHLRVQEESVIALETTLAEERAQVQELRTQLEVTRRQAAELAATAESRTAEVEQVLAKIERSRSFALVRAWWWLRRRLQKKGG